MGDMIRMTITAEGVSAYGVNFNNSWFNLSKKATCKISDFKKGQTYTVLAEKYKDKYYIQDILGAQSAPAAAASAATTIPPTAVEGTPPPGGANPVPPAGSRAATATGAAPNKDALITRQACVKSALESPAVANMIVGKSDDESVQTILSVAEKAETWVNRPI